MERRAIQDDLPENYCWGCGSLNPSGMHIKSYWEGDETICTWQPRAEHMAGPQGILNGGIIATLIDCHSVCTAVADAYRREGRALDTAPLIWYATGSLHVAYLKPTPIAAPVTLRAQVKDRTERKTVITCTLSSRGEACARGEIVAVRVPPSWRDGEG